MLFIDPTSSPNPQILSVRQSSYIALDPGTFHSPTPSILGVEMTPDVANFVLVSLNPKYSCSSLVAQLCLTLRDLLDWSSPGSFGREIS